MTIWYGPPRRWLHAVRRRLSLERQRIAFYPLIFIGLAVLLFFATGDLGEHTRAIQGGFRKGLVGLLIFGGDAQAARSILSAVAATWVTILSVVFSVTMVVLQLASNAFTAELVSRIKRATITQLTLGSFVGIVTYALLLLKVVRGNGGGFVPVIGVNVVIVWAVISVVLMVLFIGYLSTEIQPTTLIQKIADDGISALSRLSAPTRQAWVQPVPDESIDGKAPGGRELWATASKGGYVQRIDGSLLFQVIRHALGREGESHIEIALERAIGDRVTRGDHLGRVLVTQGDESLGESLVAWIEAIYGITNERTADHDPRYAADELTNTAIRALHRGDVDLAQQALQGLTRFYGAVVEQTIPSTVEVCHDGSRALISLQTPRMQEDILRELEHVMIQGIEKRYGGLIDTFFAATAALIHRLVCRHRSAARGNAKQPSAARQKRAEGEAQALRTLLARLEPLFGRLVRHYHDQEDLVDGTQRWVDVTAEAIGMHDSLAACLVDFLAADFHAIQGKSEVADVICRGFRRFETLAGQGDCPEVEAALTAHPIASAAHG